ATIVPSSFVSRKTLTPYYNARRRQSGPAGPRERRFSAMRAFEALVMLERVDDDDDGRPHQDDEQGREDAADHGEEHFQRGLRGLLLGTLTATAPHLFRLDAEHLGDADAELLGLDQRLDEGVQLLDAGAAAHVIERLQSRPTEADLVEHLRELVREGVLELFRQPADAGVEAQTGLD